MLHVCMLHLHINVLMQQFNLLFFVSINRGENITRDIWMQLERNWLHFFWLTGEIPSTLQIVVNRIENLFMPNIARGRNQCINFRNQVSTLDVSATHCCIFTMIHFKSVQ